MKMIKGKTPVKQYGVKILVLCFWLLLWEITSRILHKEIFLPSPVVVLKTMLELIQGFAFWKTILFSFARIVLGFSLSVFVGTAFAVISYRFRLWKELISPLITVIKAMPVASFIILALLWINKRNLSVLCSFTMVLPMVYISVLQGLEATDEKLLQMAKVFHLGSLKKIKAIYLPSVLPFFISGVSMGLGFCWKAGIAAEVIGLPSGSIGEQLYEAKLYLMTKELFAWTVVIILISILFEKAVMLIIRLLQQDAVVNSHDFEEQ